MHFNNLLAVTFAALSASACAVQTSPQLPPGPAARCEEVVAEGMSERQADAKKMAKEGVNQQLADARGNLLALGLKRIRGTSYENHCRPDALGLGLVKCTAVARLCGR